MPLDYLNARTRVIALIGDPISHSVSPRAQSFALAQSDINALCLAFPVKSDALAQAIRGAQSLNMRGVMVTIPHKEAVLSLCDELHPSARLVGAVNFLEFRSDGTICGHSSDGWAALRSLEDKGVRIGGTRVAILGGGGSARSLALTFADAGAAHITLYNRTIERAQIIADEVQTRTGVPALVSPLPASGLSDSDIIINTTSVGMTPDINSSPLDADAIEAKHTVFDIVYNPLETRLLREAKERGAKVVNGLDMVLWTNVYAAQIGLNAQIKIEDLRAEALRALHN